MLNDENLDKLFLDHGLLPIAIATIKHIRSCDPSRPIRSGQHNVATHYASQKMGCVIKAEASSTELAATYKWDHDNETYEYWDQPPWIKKFHDPSTGRPRATRYTPDFFRLSRNFIGWVECKTLEYLVSQLSGPFPQYILDDGIWRCPAAEHYAETVGLGFQMCVAYPGDKIITANIVGLSDYYRLDCPPPTEWDLQKAHSVMGSSGWCWLRDLQHNECDLSVDSINKLIADELVHVDLTSVVIMSEPHRTRVFKTKELLDSSQHWLESLSDTATLDVTTLNLAAGSRLKWDGVTCEILNLGETHVYLRMPDGSMPSLTHEELEKFFEEKAIVGTDVVLDPRVQLASERLQKASAEEMRWAMHRLYCIHPEFCPDGEVHTASERAIRYWRVAERKGKEEFGSEFIGLLPQIGERGNRKRRFCGKTLGLMELVFNEEVKSASAPTLSSCWAILKSMCEERGLLAPSEKTFREEIRRLSDPESLKKAREGEKAGYDYEVPFLTLTRDTPRHGSRPFEIAHIDHSELDLQFVSEATGMSMGKAWLTVLIDAFTRKVLAWVLTFDSPSARSCMLALRDCVRRHGRLPAIIVSDQGSDFKSTHYETLLAMFKIHKRMRPASHPKFGCIVERHFGVLNTTFIHNLRGNNKALQSPRRMSPTHDPRELAVWNLRAFREAFEGYLAEFYHAAEHPALGVSPTVAETIGWLQTGARGHVLIPYTRAFVIQTLPTTKKGTAKIQKDGSFNVKKFDYFNLELLKYVGEDLSVRYDPFDVSHAFALGKKGWIQCISTHAGMLAGRTYKEIEAISAELTAVHGRAGMRQNDHASLLGAFLRSMRDVEANLAIERQQARDRELRSSDAKTGLLGIPHDGPQTPAANPSTKAEPAMPAPAPATPTSPGYDIDFAAIQNTTYEEY